MSLARLSAAQAVSKAENQALAAKKVGRVAALRRSAPSSLQYPPCPEPHRHKAGNICADLLDGLLVAHRSTRPLQDWSQGGRQQLESRQRAQPSVGSQEPWNYGEAGGAGRRAADLATRSEASHDQACKGILRSHAECLAQQATVAPAKLPPSEQDSSEPFG